jgi:hypothetical protein
MGFLRLILDFVVFSCVRFVSSCLFGKNEKKSGTKYRREAIQPYIKHQNITFLWVLIEKRSEQCRARYIEREHH